MKYAVFGPREGRIKGQVYGDAAHVAHWLGSLKDIDLVIAGGGKGIEDLAEKWATKNNVPFKLIRPKWNAVGEEGTIPQQIAFNKRNMEILTECDIVVSFWDGRFKDMIDIFRTAIIMQKQVILFPMS